MECFFCLAMVRRIATSSPPPMVHWRIAGVDMKETGSNEGDRHGFTRVPTYHTIRLRDKVNQVQITQYDVGLDVYVNHKKS